VACKVAERPPPDVTKDTPTMVQTHEPNLLEDILGDEQEHADELAGWPV
jgi:hypothetical protein